MHTLRRSSPQPGVALTRQPVPQELALYLDHKADESYTPKNVSVRVGNSLADLKARGPALAPPPLTRQAQEVCNVTLEEPKGWLHLSLLPPVVAGLEGCVRAQLALARRSRPRQHCSERKAPRAYLVQVAVVGNHQNGRDTHIRQAKVFGPRQSQSQGASRVPVPDLALTPLAVLFPHLTTPEFTAYAVLR